MPVSRPRRTFVAKRRDLMVRRKMAVDLGRLIRKTIRAGCSRNHMPKDEPHYSTATVTRKYVAAITVVSLLELLF